MDIRDYYLSYIISKLILKTKKKILFLNASRQYDKNNQQYCEVECCDYNCVSFENIDVDRRVIIFKSVERNFPSMLTFVRLNFIYFNGRI